MQKISISCGGVNLLVMTDSNEVINLFLQNRGILQKTIPGVTVKIVDNNAKMTEPYIIYMDSNESKITINEKTNKAIIKLPVQNLFFPDFLY